MTQINHQDSSGAARQLMPNLGRAWTFAQPVYTQDCFHRQSSAGGLMICFQQWRLAGWKKNRHRLRFPSNFSSEYLNDASAEATYQCDLLSEINAPPLVPKALMLQH